MEEKEFMEIFNEIVTALKSAGYNPYEQLIGYLELGNETFITRKCDARDKIKLLDTRQIKEHLYLVK